MAEAVDEVAAVVGDMAADVGRLALVTDEGESVVAEVEAAAAGRSGLARCFRLRNLALLAIAVAVVVIIVQRRKAAEGEE